jgi:ABC-2 type transport system ATP-binding protein
MTDSNTPLLELKGLHRRFGDRVAVDSLSLTVSRGEVVGLLGPNGSGKTTAFRLLTGSLSPNKGEVLVDGRPAKLSDRDFRSRLGVVFQTPSLDRKLTGRQNLQLHAALHGVGGDEARSRIEELLALVKLSDRADEIVDRYSGGMKRRLDLGRVLIHDPEILVMDEPTTGLDESSFRAIWSRLHQRCKDSGRSVLLTSHRPEEAAMCDRLLVLDEGKVIAQGTPQELIAQVQGDVVLIEAADLDELASELNEKFGDDLGPARVHNGHVRLECSEGHAWVPRVVEAFPIGRMRSVSLHRPDLADVFLKIAGRSLDG